MFVINPKIIVLRILILCCVYSGAAVAGDNEEILVLEDDLVTTTPLLPKFKDASDDQEERCTWSNFLNYLGHLTKGR